MSQIPTVKRYRPEAGKPFPSPKSGSDWTLEELNYIGIDHKLDCALDDIVPPSIILSPKITDFLVKRLNKPWEDLLTSEIKEDRESFYARLLQIAGPKPKGGPYDIPFTSSQLSESTPPPEFEEPRTPEGGPSPMQPPRPSPQRIRPSGYNPFSPASPTRAKRTGKLPEATPQTSSAFPTPAKKTKKLTEATPQTSSDPSYDGSSLQRAESDSDREEEKDLAEKDVEALTRSLLYLIEAAVLEVLPSLDSETRNPPKLHFLIGGSLMSTRPDLALNIQIEDDKAEIYVECKKEGHNKKPEELTGQEIAHMIGTTVAFRRNVKEQDTYNMYLISWHHTECYFSRLDMTEKHIRQLIEEEVDDRPHDLNVKRSRPYDVTDHDERVEVAKAITRLLILEVKKHSRSLARFLQT